MMRLPAEAFGMNHPELVVDPAAPAALLACLDGRAEAAAKGGEAAARLVEAGVGSWDIEYNLFRFYGCCLCTRESCRTAASASSSQQQPAAASSQPAASQPAQDDSPPSQQQPGSEVMEEEEDGVEDEEFEEEEVMEEEEDGVEDEEFEEEEVPGATADATVDATVDATTDPTTDAMPRKHAHTGCLPHTHTRTHTRTRTHTYTGCLPALLPEYAFQQPSHHVLPPQICINTRLESRLAL
jgi:hypothetical protein